MTARRAAFVVGVGTPVLGRGWSREDLAKVAALNLLRVMRESERVAAELQLAEAACDVLIEEVDSRPSGSRDSD